jgi:hypothetical protein
VKVNYPEKRTCHRFYNSTVENIWAKYGWSYYEEELCDLYRPSIIVIIIVQTIVAVFLHVKRMPGNRLPLKVLEWEPEGTRRRGRPKEGWIDGVRRSMTNHGLTEEDTSDRDR